jgi:hypothetical protein
MIYAIFHLLLLPSSPENMTRVHFNVLLHFCSNPSVKGKEGENKETLVKHAIVGISEDNKHDTDAVLEFEKQALDIVSKDIHIQIKEIHQWTETMAIDPDFK